MSKLLMKIKQNPKRKKGIAKQQIDIIGVHQGTLEISSHRYRRILEVSPINFELKSEAEQDSLIENYESFLNALSCPLQYLIRTREIDIDKYLQSFINQYKTETNKTFRMQLSSYIDYVRSLIATSQILTRHFYVIVPYDNIIDSNFQSSNIEQLQNNVDIIKKGFNRLGMATRELTSLEVLDLFYSFYSPSKAKVQPLHLSAINSIQELLVMKGNNH